MQPVLHPNWIPAGSLCYLPSPQSLLGMEGLVTYDLVSAGLPVEWEERLRRGYQPKACGSGWAGA